MYTRHILFGDRLVVLATLSLYMLNQVDRNSGWREHHGRPGCLCGYVLPAIYAFESSGGKQLIGFIKIIHVHAYSSQVLVGNHVRLRDVDIEAVRILHAYAGYFQIADILLPVTSFKSESLEQLD